MDTICNIPHRSGSDRTCTSPNIWLLDGVPTHTRRQTTRQGFGKCTRRAQTHSPSPRPFVSDTKAHAHKKAYPHPTPTPRISRYVTPKRHGREHGISLTSQQARRCLSVRSVRTVAPSCSGTSVSTCRTRLRPGLRFRWMHDGAALCYLSSFKASYLRCRQRARRFPSGVIVRVEHRYFFRREVQDCGRMGSGRDASGVEKDVERSA